MATTNNSAKYNVYSMSNLIKLRNREIQKIIDINKGIKELIKTDLEKINKIYCDVDIQKSERELLEKFFTKLS